MLARQFHPDLVKDLLETKDSSEVTKAFFDALQSGKATVFFRLQENQSILYEAIYDRVYTNCTVYVGGKVAFYSFLPDIPPAFAKTLALYVYLRDSASSEEELALRYGSNYASLARMGSLSGKELEVFLNAKKAIVSLSQALEKTRIDPPSRKESSPSIDPHLRLSITRDGNEFYLDLGVQGNAFHRIPSVKALVEKVNSGALLAERGGAYVDLSIDRWSQEDQKVIFFLMGLHAKASASYYYRDPSVLNEEQFVRLLLLWKGRLIDYEGDETEVEPETHSIVVSLDDEGRIVREGSHSRPIAVSGLTVAHYSGRRHLLTLSRFKNAQEKALSDFLDAHPDLPYGLLQEEISSEILPRLRPDANVSTEFRKKAQAYRADIAYYITYDDQNSEDVYLKTETKYVCRGQEITKEDYLLTPGEHYESFSSALAAFGLPEQGRIKDEQEIGRILDSDLTLLGSCCALYLSDNISPSLVKHKANITLRTKSDVDWFEVSYLSNELSVEEVNAILKAYRKKKKYVRVGSSYFATDDQALASAVETFGVEDSSDSLEATSRKLPLYQALKLQSGTGLRVDTDRKLERLFHDLLHYSSIEVSLTPTMEGALRPYQLEGVKWMVNLARHGLGGILADDMGLGKTLETIAALHSLGEKEPVLIVSPKSLIYNWKSEFAKWDPTRPVTVIVGSKSERTAIVHGIPKSEGAVYIVSYDSFRNDEDLYQGIVFSSAILDEAQSIANVGAQKTRAVKTINAEHRFVLTGTPIQNSYMDLWSIMDFLMPGYLEGYKEFRMIYSSFGDQKEAEIEKLEREVAPFLLRRTKEEVLKELPPKSEEVLVVTMEEKERKIYAAYHENAVLSLRQAGEDGRQKIALLAELTRLRQLCVDPSSFLEDFHDVSSKLSQTLSMIEVARQGGHKVLVFSSFVTVLKHLQSLLNEGDVLSYLIYGDTPAQERLEIADEFNASKDPSVMLVSLKAGGTGLNLVGADIVIHLDPWWNVAAENQASDRAHRIGQTRPVSVYKLVSQGTIEEKIIELQNKKKGLTNILRVADGTGNSLTQEDIDFLLR